MKVLNYSNGTYYLPNGTEWEVDAIVDDKYQEVVTMFIGITANLEIALPLEVRYYYQPYEASAALCCPSIIETLDIAQISVGGCDSCGLEEHTGCIIELKERILDAIHRQQEQAKSDKAEAAADFKAEEY